MIEWINNRLNLNLQEEEIRNVRDFALIWNIFEGVLFRTRFTVRAFQESLQNRNFNPADFDEALNYFRNR